MSKHLYRKSFSSNSQQSIEKLKATYILNNIMHSYKENRWKTVGGNYFNNNKPLPSRKSHNFPGLRKINKVEEIVPRVTISWCSIPRLELRRRSYLPSSLCRFKFWVVPYPSTWNLDYAPEEDGATAVTLSAPRGSTGRARERYRIRP